MFSCTGLAVEVGVHQPRPDLDHFLWSSTVHQYQVIVHARILPVLLVNIKGSKATVFFRRQAQFFQTHPCIDVIDGEESNLLGDLVKT